MNSDLIYYITNHAGSLSVEEILFNFLSAFLLGGIIFVSYRFSHGTASYSAKFNITLWALTLITTLVMCVIGNNVALSLGMVGALSIVRFRTAVKDTRDAAYIFWCIAGGICCGISDYVIAFIGSTVIFLLFLFMGGVQNNEKFLLIVRGSREAMEAIEKAVSEIYHDKARICVCNTTRDTAEYIYELSRRQFQKYAAQDVLSKTLYEIPDVNSVNIVAQNDEISR